MNKKIAFVVASTIGALSVTGVAFAETTAVAPSTSVHPKQEMMLQVGPAGRTLLRGTVVSSGAGILTVKSWGGNWTVNVPGTAQVAPQGTSLTSFQVGDFVGVQGTMDANAAWTVNATLVRDWTERQAIKQEASQNAKAAKEMVRAETPKTIEGTLSGLAGQTFTLTTTSGGVYNVTLSPNAKVLEKNWLTLDLGQVHDGDTARVWGPVSSSTISASIFRDLSIPRK